MEGFKDVFSDSFGSWYWRFAQNRFAIVSVETHGVVGYHARKLVQNKLLDKLANFGAVD